MTRMLVTGGAGFVGATFVRYTVQNHPGYEVVVLTDTAEARYQQFGR